MPIEEATENESKKAGRLDRNADRVGASASPPTAITPGVQPSTSPLVERQKRRSIKQEINQQNEAM
jgi:hypothetical protein